MSFGKSSLPDWAVKFSYDHHSKSGLQSPFSKQLVRKMHPEVRDPIGVPATAGKAAEVCATNVVAKGMTFSEAFRDALAVLDRHKIAPHLTNDQADFDLIRDCAPGKDKKKNPDNRTIFERACANLVEGLQEACAGANRIETSQYINLELPRCDLFFEGEIDVVTNGVVEIKTKWPKASDTKQGFTTRSIPARPDIWHVRQVALYWKWMREQSENVPIKILYADFHKYRLFTSDDCPQLSEEHLNEALKFLAGEARTREKMLSRAATKEELFEIIPAEADHWFWNTASPELIAKRNELWGR